MYADQMRRRRVQPVSLGAALLVNGAMFAALIYAVPQAFKVMEKPTDLPTIDIRDYPPPPPPENTETKPETVRDTVIYVPPVPVPVTVSDLPPVTTTDRVPDVPVTPFVGTPEGTGEKPVVEAPKPVLALMPALQDPRYARDFQPEYPGIELRNNRDGFVTVRVRIGTDGRVKAVEQVSATSPAFFEATRKHALARWRFKPATRGGVAEESWKQMKVRFEMTES